MDPKNAMGLRLKKNPPRPKMQPPYNKTQEMERKAKQAQRINDPKQTKEPK